MEIKVNKVSLILTTFNNVKVLPYTLESIENQDYARIEVNIKDGGSTDGTMEIIKQYQKKSKYEVHWITRSDTGIYDAMNQGYQLATGDIIVFFNDQFVREDAVSKMVCLMEQMPGCIGAHADLVYATDEKVVRYWKMGPQKSLYCGWMPGHPTLFLKREIYERYGLYRTDYRISADYEFMVRFLKDSSNKLAYLPEIIIRMYYGGTSTSGLKSYIQSLQEGHRALKENGVRHVWCIDFLRTMRVMFQFVLKPNKNIISGIFMMSGSKAPL